MSFIHDLQQKEVNAVEAQRQAAAQKQALDAQVHSLAAQSIPHKSEQSQMLLDQYRGLIPDEAIKRGNTTDYDLGMWLQHASYDDVAKLIDDPKNAHFNDIGKLPNHYTFSTESAYSNSNHRGGKWDEGNNGHWTFTASPYNLTQHTADQMREYFANNEADNTLVIPDASGSTKLPVMRPNNPITEYKPQGLANSLVGNAHGLIN